MRVITVSVDELEQIIEKSVAKVLATSSPKELPAPTVVKENASRRQAASYFNVSLPTLAEWTRSGRVKASRIGRRVLYKWADLESALSSIKTEVAA